MLLFLATLAFAEEPVAETDTPTTDATPPAGPSLAAKTGVAGTVVSAAGAPLAGIYVYAGDVDATTDAEGKFFLPLPPGAWEVSAASKGFVGATLTVPVAEGTVETRFELAAATEASDDVDGVIVVAASRKQSAAAVLIAEKRESAQVMEVIGAAQVARTGDTNAATAMRRVTGVTTVGGRYLYVRGLGDRYASTRLDGATLPSPEAERRVVPMDMLPTSLLGDLAVQKTWSPDQPGEFGGGTVALRSKAVPTQRIAELRLSGAWRTGTTFADGPAAFSGGTDWLGFGQAARALPDSVAAASSTEPLRQQDMFSDRGYSAEELEAFGEAIPNRWSLGVTRPRPDVGVSAAFGDRVAVRGGTLGGLVALTYRNTWLHERPYRAFYNISSGDTLELDSAYQFDQLTNTSQLGGVAQLGATFGQSEVQYTALLTRVGENEGRVYEGLSFDVGTDIRVSRARWTERSLLTQQLRGTHTVGPVQARWRYALSFADSARPDQREWRQDLDATTGAWRLSDNERFDNLVHDRVHDAGLDLTWKLPVPSADPDHAWALSIGGQGVDRARSSDTRRFNYRARGPVATDAALLTQDPSKVFTADSIGKDGWQFEESTLATDNYTATQRLWAGYLNADLPLRDGLRVSAGARVEASDQAVDTFELFNPDAATVTSTLATLDVLPGATVTWELGDQHQLRAGYGRTLNRPDFRELSPSTYTDVTGGRETHGNPDLRRATIDNVDLRWEFYPSESETISVGGFYKSFHDPIETIVVVSNINAVSFANAERATNLGLEAEVRKSLPLPGLWVAANGTLMRSRVNLADGGFETSKSRPLQGQSPWIANLTVGYDAPFGLSATGAFHLSGRRISQVGSAGAPDMYEEPAPQLDLTATQLLGRGFKLGVRAQNLLDAERRETQGGETVFRVRQGRLLTLQASWEP
jgi:outer membrane receptor protein involved in Fe transport